MTPAEIEQGRRGMTRWLRRLGPRWGAWAVTLAVGYGIGMLARWLSGGGA